MNTSDRGPALLILGAASPTGRSLAKGLRLSKKYRTAELIGGDVFDNRYTIAEGLYDRLVRMPRCDHENHKEVLRSIVKRYEVAACVVLAELEVISLADADIGAPLLIPPSDFCTVAASKKHVFSILSPLGLSPKHVNDLDKDCHLSQLETAGMEFPVWIRSGSAGTTSGMGSFLAYTPADLMNWLTIMPCKEIQAAEHLPGRNWACLMTYIEGRLTAFGIYERVSYLMARAAPSGVTGNISEGQIKWSSNVLDVSRRAVEAIEARAGVPAQGFLTVDLKESKNGAPMVTEVNLKPVACVGCFGHPLSNLAEHTVDLILGDRPTSSFEDCTRLYRECYSDEPYILRDVDGDSQLVYSFSLPDAGVEIGRPSSPSWWRPTVTCW